MSLGDGAGDGAGDATCVLSGVLVVSITTLLDLLRRFDTSGLFFIVTTTDFLYQVCCVSILFLSL